jgi:hypothetical protein
MPAARALFGPGDTIAREPKSCPPRAAALRTEDARDQATQRCASRKRASAQDDRVSLNKLSRNEASPMSLGVAKFMS